MKITKYRRLVEAPVNNIDKVAELEGEDLKEKIIQELESNGFKTAANLLKTLQEKQFVYFAESLGKNAFSDDENIFLNFLNNKNAKNVLKDFKIFTKAYNILINTDYNTDEFLN